MPSNDATIFDILTDSVLLLILNYSVVKISWDDKVCDMKNNLFSVTNSFDKKYKLEINPPSYHLSPPTRVEQLQTETKSNQQQALAFKTICSRE